MEYATEERGNANKMISSKSIYNFSQFGSLAVLVILFAYGSLLSFGTEIQDFVFLLVTLSAIAYSVGLKLSKTTLLSTSWILLGIIFISAWIVSGLASEPSILIWAAILLAAYEFNRFSFVMRTAQDAVGSLDELSATKYGRVIRHHAFDTLLIVSASLAFSIAVTGLSEGLLILFTPPVFGVAIFAFLAVLLIAVLATRLSQ
ncbi:MAG: hypothetical protein ACRDF4_08820 [Rhabdochlamydiaceae bacterium]